MFCAAFIAIEICPLGFPDQQIFLEHNQSSLKMMRQNMLPFRYRMKAIYVRNNTKKMIDVSKVYSNIDSN